jgi:hypothetical protein
VHLDRRRRLLQPVEHDRQRLPLARRLALHLDELRGVRHRIDNDHEFRGERQRQQRLLAGRQLDQLERDFLHHPFEGVFGQVDARAPEYLAAILRGREPVWLVRGDRTHARTHRERHFDHLIERGLEQPQPGGVQECGDHRSSSRPVLAAKSSALTRQS